MPDAAETSAKKDNVQAYFINGYYLTLSITPTIRVNNKYILL